MSDLFPTIFDFNLGATVKIGVGTLPGNKRFEELTGVITDIDTAREYIHVKVTMKYKLPGEPFFDEQNGRFRAYELENIPDESAQIIEKILTPTPKAREALAELGITAPMSKGEKIKAGFARKAEALGITVHEYLSRTKKGQSPTVDGVRYSPVQIAEITGRSAATVRSFLKTKYPNLKLDGKTYLKQAEFDEVVRELNALPARPGRKSKSKPATPTPVPVFLPPLEQPDTSEVTLKTVADDSPIAKLQAQLLGPKPRHYDDEPPALPRIEIKSNAINKCCERCGKLIWSNPNDDGTMGIWITGLGEVHFPTHCNNTDLRGSVAPKLERKPK